MDKCIHITGKSPICESKEMRIFPSYRSLWDRLCDIHKDFEVQIRGINQEKEEGGRFTLPIAGGMKLYDL